jgi:hypothetical protein
LDEATRHAEVVDHPLAVVLFPLNANRLPQREPLAPARSRSVV